MLGAKTARCFQVSCQDLVWYLVKLPGACILSVKISRTVYVCCAKLPGACMLAVKTLMSLYVSFKNCQELVW